MPTSGNALGIVGGGWCGCGVEFRRRFLSLLQGWCADFLVACESAIVAFLMRRSALEGLKVSGSAERSANIPLQRGATICVVIVWMRLPRCFWRGAGESYTSSPHRGGDRSARLSKALGARLHENLTGVVKARSLR